MIYARCYVLLLAEGRATKAHARGPKRMAYTWEYMFRAFFFGVLLLRGQAMAYNVSGVCDVKTA